MEIINISKEKGKVVVSLDSSELVTICNTMYNTPDDKTNAKHYKLYSDMMIARDLCQYGHIDDFCFNCIAESRSKAR